MIVVDCEQCSELLGDYVDDRLSPAQRTALDAHAASCAGCKDLLRSYRAIPGRFGARPTFACPARFEIVFGGLSPPARGGSECCGVAPALQDRGQATFEAAPPKMHASAIDYPPSAEALADSARLGGRDAFEILVARYQDRICGARCGCRATRATPRRSLRRLSCTRTATSARSGASPDSEHGSIASPSTRR